MNFDNLSLGQKQKKFAVMIAELIQQLTAHGYEVTFGEAARSDEQAIINSLGPSGRNSLRMILRQNSLFHELEAAIQNNVGSGIRNSLHEQKLAIDLNLFKNGVYLSRSEDYAEAGQIWENMGGTWGGRFSDGNHFSIAHGGRK